jgi:hypothetical protein
LRTIFTVNEFTSSIGIFFISIHNHVVNGCYLGLAKRVAIGYYYKYERGQCNYNLKKHRVRSFQIYDKHENIIKSAEYGEMWDRIVKDTTDETGISMTIDVGDYPDKLGKVTFFTYDSLGRKIMKEEWQYKNNKKYTRSEKEKYEYDTTGRLRYTYEFDNNDSLLHIIDNGNLKSDRFRRLDSIFPKSLSAIMRKKCNADTVRFDSIGRPTETIHLYNGKFLYRCEYRYDLFNCRVAELRYDDKPDSLWCITEWDFDAWDRLKVELWIVPGSAAETKEVYFYNKKGLLKRISEYDRYGLDGYTKYRYSYHLRKYHISPVVRVLTHHKTNIHVSVRGGHAPRLGGSPKTIIFYRTSDDIIEGILTNT